MILEMLLAGLFYRFRGGLLDDIICRDLPNKLIRSLWAAFVSYQTYIYWQLVPLIFLAAYAGVTPGYFGGIFDLSLKENRNFKNYLKLTLRGMFIMLPVAIITIPLEVHGPLYGVLAGAMFVPCYLAGNYLFKLSKLQGQTQYGEWLLGMCIGAASWT